MMKRKLFSLFFMVSLLLPLAAQARLGNFTQQGGASQEMKDAGFAAAHSSLPLNSNVKITNTANGKEVEVKITNRISVSSSRVIDLSAAAYQALELKQGDTVVVSVIPSPPRIATANADNSPTVELSQVLAAQTAPPAASAENANPTPAQVASSSEGEKASNEGFFPFFPMPSSSTRTGESEFLAWLMTMSMDLRDSRDMREDRDIRQEREERIAREEREAREAREARIAREEREIREIREAREVREAREEREMREARETRLAREEREAREAREAIAREGRGTRQPREPKGAPLPPPPPKEVQPQTVVNQPKFIEPPPPPPPPNEVPPPPIVSKPKPVETPPPPVENIKPAANVKPAPRNSAEAPIPVRTAEPVQAFPPPVRPEDVRIVTELPDLSDRNPDKLFRLQVGAYSARNTAVKTAEYVKDTGFDVEIEAAGSIYRVVIVGISARDVYSASLKLGAMGFGQIWVRE
ncbi:MAG: SPOR domain-containing protein [Treponema sp.]|jgi:hypothetical protein|nr:SPOR domain-containing protein [Treponema sp.]